MMKSMTGFAKADATENGVNVSVEIKSLNGKNLEMNCRMPRSLSHKELEIRELVRQNVGRGSVSVNINVELDESVKQFHINQEVAAQCYETLGELRKKLKIKDAIKMEHVLTFRDSFSTQERNDDEELQMRLIVKAMKNALKALDTMRQREGTQISKDILNRVKNVQDTVKKIEKLSLEKIPAERDRLRQRIAHLFETDEIDEHRIQLEVVLLADKLDVAEECVRLESHFKFFHETMKGKEPAGRKINFLLQEMNREINTIGSKSSDSAIAHMVVACKEEIERIREQIQNIE